MTPMLTRREFGLFAVALVGVCAAVPEFEPGVETAGVELIRQVRISRLVDHIEHAATVAGIDHVGVGSDYDSVGLTVPRGLEHIGKTPNVIAALKDRGFSDGDVAKVMWGNVLQVMQTAEAAAG